MSANEPLFKDYVKPTRRDPHGDHQRDVILSLLAQDETRRRFHAAVAAALETYGDDGPLISGCVRDHFPTDVKDRLRDLARAVSARGDEAHASWIKCGRRRPWFYAVRDAVATRSAEYDAGGPPVGRAW